VCAAALRRVPGPVVPSGVSYLAVGFEYEGVGRELVAALKFRNARTTVDWLAAGLVERLGPRADMADLVTWVPASRRQRRTRGFDQSELLARSAARQTDRPVIATLRRVDRGRQTGRSRATRLRGPVLMPASNRTASQVRDRRVLLLDDVATTGASLAAAATALRELGAAEIAAGVIAYSA